MQRHRTQCQCIRSGAVVIYCRVDISLGGGDCGTQWGWALAVSVVTFTVAIPIVSFAIPITLCAVVSAAFEVRDDLE